ncbi:MAG: LuxR C-terminal-related transcriptional regulator [Thermomicrobiales bacterium]
MQEDFPRSIARLETALAIFRDLNDEYGTATALLQLGIGTYMHVDRAEGTRLIVDSLDRFRALGDSRWAALAQAVLGRMAQGCEEFDRGIELTVEAMTAHLRLGDRWFVSWDLFALADVLMASGQLRQGVRFTGAAQALSDHLGSPVGGVSFHKLAVRVDAVREEGWFDAAWASGYALDPIEAVQAARSLLEPSAASATPSLTPRELEVAHLLAKGYTDAQIAEALFIAVSTVGTHVHHILQKLDLQSRMQVEDWLDSIEPSDGATG